VRHPELWYAFLAALGNVVGGVVVVRGARFGLRFIGGMVAFGAGFMLSVALFEVLPEAWERGGTHAAGYVLLGYLLVHLTQHTVTPHFHFGEETHAVSRLAAPTALLGLLLHTFFDGVAIASGFAVSTDLGVLLFVAVLLHKLPEGVTIASLEVASGRPHARAVGAAALLGAATVAGVLLTDSVRFLAANGLALAGGVTLYVGASNLVPEFQGKRGWMLPIAFFAGSGAFVASRWLLGLGGG
jgi:ZIP family zinc transporter/zinc and cadmium transporter